MVFCPNCGKSDQRPNAYCKGCGKYLYKHSFFPSDAPPTIAAWLAVFSALTVVVCLIGEVYPASKLSANPAFPSILILQLFSLFVAYRLHRRLTRKRGDGGASGRTEPAEDLTTSAEGLLPPNPATVTEQTTKILDRVPTDVE